MYMYVYIHIYIYIYVYISADPGLCLNRGGAWNHRRCGTLVLPCQAEPSTAGPQPSDFTSFRDCPLPRLNPGQALQQLPRAI